VSFSIVNAAGAIARGDRTHAAGCAYRALSCLAQVLFALNRRYLINEKGALAEAATFAVTIANLPRHTDDIWNAVGVGDLPSAVRQLRELADTQELLIADGGLG